MIKQRSLISNANIVFMLTKTNAEDIGVHYIKKKRTTGIDAKILSGKKRSDKE